MIKRIYYLIFSLLSTTVIANTPIKLEIYKNQAEKSILSNDLNALKINILDAFKNENQYSKIDFAAFYLLRAKYYKAISNNKLAESDIDTVLKYDIKNMEAYLLKASFLKSADDQIKLLQNGINVVENKIPLIKQQALIKIGLTAAFWDNAMYNSEPFSIEKANKEITIAKGGCFQLSNIMNIDEEAKALYEKKCKIEAIKNF